MTDSASRTTTYKPLEGIRVVDLSLLEPAALGALLAELGADVIKVESPGGGDYIRRVAWPVIEGISLLHWHSNRGKRSLVADLREPAGLDIVRELIRGADVLIEGMRPGALARRGLTEEVIFDLNPKIVYATLSGFGSTGPYRDVPSHGIAFDAWAGIANPEPSTDGHPGIPDHTSIGTKVAPIWAAMGILAAVLAVERGADGVHIDVAQADVAACVNWLSIEGWRAYERPESEVSGNAADGGARRDPGPVGMQDGVRYQYYESIDGHVLFMASERKFWKTFCDEVGRPDLFEAHPGADVADHAVGETALRAELAEIFRQRTTDDWVAFGAEVDVPIAPVNRPEAIGADPQFQHRLPWLPAAEHGADLLPSPLKFAGATLPPPRRAPAPGQHSAEVLAEVLGWSDDEIAAAVEAGIVEIGS